MESRLTLRPANVMVIASVSLLTVLLAKWGSAWMTRSGVGWVKDVGKAVQLTVNAA